MLNKTLRVAFVAFAATLLAQTSAVQAQEEVWKYGGRIDEINYAHQRIMVNDLSLQLTGSSRLFSAEGKRIDASDLAIGNTVGVNFEILPGVGRALIELQIYPDGTQPRLDHEEE